MIQSDKKDIRDLTWSDILSENADRRYNIIPTLADAMLSQEPEAFVRQIVLPISNVFFENMGRNDTQGTTDTTYALWALYQLDYLMNVFADTDATYRRYFSAEVEAKNYANLMVFLSPIANGTSLVYKSTEGYIYDTYDMNIVGMVWKNYKHIRDTDGVYMSFLFGKNKKNKRNATEHVCAIRREMMRQIPSLPLPWGYAPDTNTKYESTLRWMPLFNDNTEDVKLWRDSFGQRLFSVATGLPKHVVFFPAYRSAYSDRDKNPKISINMSTLWAAPKTQTSFLSIGDLKMLEQPDNAIAVYRPEIWHLLEQNTCPSSLLSWNDNKYDIWANLFLRVLPEILPLQTKENILGSFKVFRQILNNLDTKGKNSLMAEAALVRSANTLARSGKFADADIRMEAVSLLHDRAPNPTAMESMMRGYDDYEPYYNTILPAIENDMAPAEILKNRLGCLLAHEDYENPHTDKRGADLFANIRLCFDGAKPQTEYVLDQLLHAASMPLDENTRMENDASSGFYNVPSKRRVLIMLLTLGKMTEAKRPSLPPYMVCNWTRSMNEKNRLLDNPNICGKPYDLTFSGKQTQSFIVAMLLVNNFMTQSAIRITVNHEKWEKVFSLKQYFINKNFRKSAQGYFPFPSAEPLYNKIEALKDEDNILQIADGCVDIFGEALEDLTDFYAPLCGTNPEDVKSWLRRPELYLSLLDVALEDAPFLGPKKIKESLTEDDKTALNLDRRPIGIGMLRRQSIFGNSILSDEYQRLAYIGAVDGEVGILPASKFDEEASFRQGKSDWVSGIRSRNTKTSTPEQGITKGEPVYE